ncbi:MAG: type II toxin-antitoxin system RelE/ParE family toxin [Capnocytophaga sp.]|nr:type II toxin-antitoxin system RelE/ParE family toxin [Capnocytophaga sp.]
MGLTIFWTNFAKRELKNIYAYHKRFVSIRVAKKMVSEITNEAKKLSKQSEIGQIEKSLYDNPKQFRYLVYGNYKILYLENNNLKRIEIIDVFDCRQNPIKIKRGK